VFGKLLSERLGKWNFWLMVIGMNLTFGPMHILGLQGQPRRMVVYPEKLTGEGFFNLHFWNTVATVGSYLLAIGIFVFLVNVWRTTRKAVPAPLDPWDARSLEWLTTNPPKVHNFDVVPHVHALDEYFHLKYEEVDTDTGPRLVKIRTAEELHEEQEANADKHIHMPSASYWPMVLAVSLPIMAYGVIYSHLLTVAGGAILLMATFAWALEPSVADDSDYDPPAQGGESSQELVSV
jgi:cytochrome c oxidase subunit 1